MNKLLITIITVVFNGKGNLENTIKSVLAQKYTNIEYIIIDGGSTDGTVDIIKKYEDKISYWVSEKDNGISDAFNKGLAQATGEYILMLNCGDTLISDTAIDVDKLTENCITAFQSITPYGNIFPAGYVYSNEKGRSFSLLQKMIQNAMLSHQATFVPKSVYEEIGGYNQEYRIRMDFEFFLRASQKFEIKFFPQPIVIYLTDGISSRLKNRLLFKMEEWKAVHNIICNSCMLYDIYFFVSLPYYLFKKSLSAIKYFIIDWKN
ncbi:glycosyltransferase family 2 protein [Hydrogenimonas sp.]